VRQTSNSYHATTFGQAPLSRIPVARDRASIWLFSSMPTTISFDSLNIWRVDRCVASTGFVRNVNSIAADRHRCRAARCKMTRSSPGRRHSPKLIGKTAWIFNKQAPVLAPLGRRIPVMRLVETRALPLVREWVTGGWPTLCSVHQALQYFQSQLCPR
jgi:hypothetical protein